MINNQKLSFWLSLIAIVLSLVTICVVHLKTPLLATVDMGQLINAQAAQLGQQYPHGNVPSVVMQHIITEMKDQIKEIAKDNKVILIAKGAVLSDSLPDYTTVVKECLANQIENEEQQSEG